MDAVPIFLLLGFLAALLFLLIWLAHKISDAIFGPTFRRPEHAAPYIIEHFDKLTEKDFQKLERQIGKSFPFSPERGLVYALRISIAVRRITNLKTLASRWNTAHCGAGNSGLIMSLDSRNHPKVYAFLCDRYLRQFRQIAGQMLTEAETKETESGRRGAVGRAQKKIREAQFGFDYPMPGLHEAANRFSNPTEDHEN
jgi:hypothetical protein